MSVLVRLSVSGMTTDSYDKVSEQLTPPFWPRRDSSPTWHSWETASFTYLNMGEPG